jgi:hypothetical protein
MPHSAIPGPFRQVVQGTKTGDQTPLEENAMPFMQPEVVFGRWIEVDGPCGTEFIDADLVGHVESYQGPDVPIPEPLAMFCENTMVTDIKVIESGWGCRFTAPGFLDCTPWTVFETEDEARKYLEEQEEDA